MSIKRPLITQDVKTADIFLNFDCNFLHMAGHTMVAKLAVKI
jgi:hypothetical protein